MMRPVQVDLGLVADLQLVAFQRAPQFALQHQPLDRGGVHLRGVEGEGVAAVLLRVVHRRVRVADQVDDVLGIARAEGDADARGEEHLVLVQLQRAAHLGQERACQLRNRSAVVGIGRQALHEQRELIPGEPSHHGLLRQRARQALGQHFERAIAGAVAEGVVDLLEAVHVQVQHRHHLSSAQRTRDGLLQQVVELHAVRDLGERVVTRQIAYAAFGALAVGDVARHEDVALELRVVAVDARAGERHRDRLTTARAHHRLARLLRRLQQIEAGALPFLEHEHPRAFAYHEPIAIFGEWS